MDIIWCIIFLIHFDGGSTGATSSIAAQGTADSHELTAMEKITKLKTQWLNQLK